MQCAQAEQHNGIVGIGDGVRDPLMRGVVQTQSHGGATADSGIFIVTRRAAVAGFIRLIVVTFVKKRQ